MVLILSFCMMMQIEVAEGSASRHFVIKKSFDEVADHIQKEIDDVYEAMGVHVIERKDGNVKAEATTQFGKVEWNHKEKIERTAEKVVVKINATGDKFKLSAIIVAEPHKRGTKVNLESTMSIEDDRVGPKLIDIGIGKVLDKIKRHLKGF
jgi:hypothetical protein